MEKPAVLPIPTNPSPPPTPTAADMPHNDTNHKEVTTQREVTILGPGIGECIVIHLGKGKWFIVDSFIDKQSKMPAAIEYLKSKNIPLENVTGIIATHWHCDHIKGLDEIIENCPNATFFFSAALCTLEAEIYFKVMKEEASLGSRSFSETMNRILLSMETKDRSVRAIKVKEHTLLFQDRETQTQLIALSPSEEAVDDAISKMAIPKPNERRKKLGISGTPNLNAVVLYLQFGAECAVILGSDLEVTENSATGWNGILTSRITEQLGLAPASLFKVPHHGSANGFHPGIWSDLLKEKPIAMATCYSASKLPKEEEINRILSLSEEFYLTSSPKFHSPKKHRGMIDKQINAHTKNRRAVRGKHGRVTAQIDESGTIKIDYKEPAFKVTHPIKTLPV